MQNLSINISYVHQLKLLHSKLCLSDCVYYWNICWLRVANFTVFHFALQSGQIVCNSYKKLDTRLLPFPHEFNELDCIMSLTFYANPYWKTFDFLIEFLRIIITFLYCYRQTTIYIKLNNIMYKFDLMYEHLFLSRLSRLCYTLFRFRNTHHLSPKTVAVLVTTIAKRLLLYVHLQWTHAYPGPSDSAQNATDMFTLYYYKYMRRIAEYLFRILSNEQLAHETHSCMAAGDESCVDEQIVPHILGRNWFNSANISRKTWILVCMRKWFIYDSILQKGVFEFLCVCSVNKCKSYDTSRLKKPVFEALTH